MFSNSPFILTKFYGPDSASVSVSDKANSNVQQSLTAQNQKDQQRDHDLTVTSTQESLAEGRPGSNAGLNRWRERWMYQRKSREEAWNKYFEQEHLGPVTEAQNESESISGGGPESFHPSRRCHPWMTQRCHLWSSCYSDENRPIFKEFDFA